MYVGARQCFSGPRFYEEYKSNPCTADCPCEIDESGCSGSHEACRGSLLCNDDDQCSFPTEESSEKGSEDSSEDISEDTENIRWDAADRVIRL